MVGPGLDVDVGPEEKSNAHHWIQESNELQTGCFISPIILQQNWLYVTQLIPQLLV